MRIEELIKQAESQRLEFKESFGKDTVETVAAFCNTSGAVILHGEIEKFRTGFFRIQQELQEYPELQLTIEALQGFTRSGLDVIAQRATEATLHDTDHDTNYETDYETDHDTPHLSLIHI